MDTTLHITKDGLELSRTSEAADDFLFETTGDDVGGSGRRLSARRTMSIQANVAGGVAVQEPTSSTSGSRVCPATGGDFNAGRNCYDVSARKCVKCRGNNAIAGSGSLIGSLSGGASSSFTTAGSRACPATWGDVKAKRTCFDASKPGKNKCVKCADSGNEDDYLVGGSGFIASRVCPANTADANNNRNCYDVWKKKCVKCSGKFKTVTESTD